MDKKFKIKSEYLPAGDQPKAIESLVNGIQKKLRDQVLLGVTGSGKTFTMAHIIAKIEKPTLIIVHNKTLAAQVYSEMKELFPENAVEYFVSYYDYYQPEAYISRTDTYIEKDASINEQISLLRHSATRSLLERRDVVVVSSVSAIYGLGSPELYSKMTLLLTVGGEYKRKQLLDRLVELQYKRNDINFTRGTFRIRGENVEIFPSHQSDKAWRLTFFGDKLEKIKEFDPLIGTVISDLNRSILYANSHYVTPRDVLLRAVEQIRLDLKERIAYFESIGKFLEAQRIKERTNYDIEMILETGYCKGIENYSRYLSGSKPGAPPPTLLQYFPKDSIMFLDESHVTVPQIRAMYNGDKARKTSLIEYGFRLPSALDNRPLKFEEWDNFRTQTVFVSATPGIFELELTEGVIVEQVIRPTGLLDPVCIIKPLSNQVDDLLEEIRQTIAEGNRVMVTVLTKKMAEDLASYLKGLGYKAEYLHSMVHTLERLEIIKDLREGIIEIIIGVNLLREGLNIPECATVAVLDADKEGFLRSEVSLIQTIGRAARNEKGKVILYADNITNSIERAVHETNRRRALQSEYNKKHGIVPKTVNSSIKELFHLKKVEDSGYNAKQLGKLLNNPKKMQDYIKKLQGEMLIAASNLEFEKAAELREKIRVLKEATVTLT